MSDRPGVFLGALLFLGMISVSLAQRPNSASLRHAGFTSRLLSNGNDGSHVEVHLLDRQRFNLPNAVELSFGEGLNTPTAVDVSALEFVPTAGPAPTSRDRRSLFPMSQGSFFGIQVQFPLSGH